MKSDNISDKTIREKIQVLDTVPMVGLQRDRSATWKNIENNLEKKRVKSTRWYVAAAIIFIVLSSVYMRIHLDKNKNEATATVARVEKEFKGEKIVADKYTPASKKLNVSSVPKENTKTFSRRIKNVPDDAADSLNAFIQIARGGGIESRDTIVQLTLDMNPLNTLVEVKRESSPADMFYLADSKEIEYLSKVKHSLMAQSTFIMPNQTCRVNQ